MRACGFCTTELHRELNLELSFCTCTTEQGKKKGKGKCGTSVAVKFFGVQKDDTIIIIRLEQ